MSPAPSRDDRLPAMPEENVEELYENALCGFLSTTPDGRIVKVNRTLAKWIGSDVDCLVGCRRFAELLTVGGRIFYETHFVPLLQMSGVATDIALDLQCDDGRVMPTLISAVQKRDESGKAILNRITVFNAAERRSYERELLLAKKRAEEIAADLQRSNLALVRTNEELGQFAFAASHDLQEPLRTMTVYSQLLALKHADQLDDEANGILGHIIDGSQRMKHLISDLLSWSEAQESSLRLRRNELKVILSAALRNLGATIEQSRAVVTHDELPVLTTDAARLAQVFQNLIGNAIKYANPGLTPVIHISSSRQGEREWLFAVQDNGLGFDPEYADSIFTMFKRLHGREIAGTGIGLAICKKIIESHGGRIWATSTPGVGSCFSFTIPDPDAE